MPPLGAADGIDRSLIRRAMWGLLPEIVLTNRLSGLQLADGYEKLESQRREPVRQIAELSESPLVCCVIDLERIESAIKNWPTGSGHTTEVFQEYNLAPTRDVAGGRFLRWFESANQIDLETRRSLWELEAASLRQEPAIYPYGLHNRQELQ